MQKFIKTLGLAALCALTSIGASAQTFDLSTQRFEEQRVKPVPGKKIDHEGIAVNPTPHSMQLDRAKTVDIAKGFVVVDKKKSFGNGELSFLTQGKGGLKLTIDYGKGIAAKAGVKSVSGAYALTINAKGVTITGYDERGAYYGVQTLRELLASPACAKSLPTATINDYPDLPNRGVVEGFYGAPWSHEVRLSLIRYYGRNKMNIYLYGPKDDPYHSCPNWRLPYPAKEEKQIRELIDACKLNRVDFVWAIHPGADIKWNEEDYQNLLKKFERMYELGVRSYALFFDDINGEGTNPHKQVELINRLEKEFVKAKGDVDHLTFCPTDYSKIWADGTPTGALATYGNTMDKDVKIFWTGDYVCSDLTKDTMDWFNARIKRPGYYWWNCPVTDMCRERLPVGFMPAWIVMQSPAYGLDTTLTNEDCCGILSNPMEYGEASKIQLYGTADYAWNIKAYNPMDAWERGLVDLMPNCADAYRTFAIHSGDTETGYRRAESWETNTFRLKDWSIDKALAIYADFAKCETVESEILAKCDNQLLLGELKPWLTELTRLGERGRKAIELAMLKQANASDKVFWDNYQSTLMSREQLASFLSHRIGTLKLQPFYVAMMSDLGADFMKKLSGSAEVRDSLALANMSLGVDQEAWKAFDNSALTSYRVNGSVTFNAAQGVKGYKILSNKPSAAVTVRQLDAEGKVVAEDKVLSSSTCVKLAEGAVKLTIAGDIELYEIIARN